MKETILLSAITLMTSNLFAGDLSDAFKNGKIKGELKSYYFQEKQSDTGSSSIFHNGGSINYLTGNYYGFNLGSTFQASSVSNIDGTNRFTEDEDASGAVLSELFVSYTKGNSSVKVGRQYIGTPLIAGSGSRMIRQSFQGYTFTNKDLPNTSISLIYVDRFQGRTDNNGNTGNFVKTFITNSPYSNSPYSYTLEKGAYSIYLENTSIKDLDINAQYVDAIDNFKTVYLDSTYNLGNFSATGQYIGTKFDDNKADGNFIALKLGTKINAFTINAAVSKNISNGNVESGLGYGADTSLTANEIYGGVFSYINGAKAYKLDVGTKIDKVGINLAYVYTDLENNKSNDKETDITVSYDVNKNLKINLLHAIVDGTEDYSRPKADSETRIKIQYTF